MEAGSRKTRKLEVTFCIPGCLPVVDLLLDKGSDISAVCVEGKTALHCATQMGHVEVVKRLFNHGAEKLINIEDRAKWTPLHFAAERGSLILVNLFIQVCLATEALQPTFGQDGIIPHRY